MEVVDHNLQCVDRGTAGSGLVSEHDASDQATKRQRCEQTDGVGRSVVDSVMHVDVDAADVRRDRDHGGFGSNERDLWRCKRHSPMTT